MCEIGKRAEINRWTDVCMGRKWAKLFNASLFSPRQISSKPRPLRQPHRPLRPSSLPARLISVCCKPAKVIYLKVSHCWELKQNCCPRILPRTESSAGFTEAAGGTTMTSMCLCSHAVHARVRSTVAIGSGNARPT